MPKSSSAMVQPNADSCLSLPFSRSASLQQNGFGDFELDGGGESGIHDGAADVIDEILLAELVRGHVHGYPLDGQPFVAPDLHLPAGLFEHPAADRVDQPSFPATPMK